MVEGIENIESLRFPGVPSSEEEEKIFEAWWEKRFANTNWAGGVLRTGFNGITNYAARTAWMAAKGVKE